ncbi:MAG: LysM peptidoglycan-binding domain-containing protein [Planctomycetota bacterium]
MPVSGSVSPRPIANALPNPDRMRVGLLLVIPDRQALDGSAVPAPGTGSAAVRDPLVAAEARIHIVGEGETLSEIAAAHLGSARRWPEIVAANRDRIDDPDRVRPGTELRLP